MFSFLMAEVLMITVFFAGVNMGILFTKTTLDTEDKE